MGYFLSSYIRLGSSFLYARALSTVEFWRKETSACADWKAKIIKNYVALFILDRRGGLLGQQITRNIFDTLRISHKSQVSDLFDLLSQLGKLIENADCVNIMSIL